MAAVTSHLVLADLFRGDERQPVVLPFVESATHRIDIGVSKILHRLGCKGRPGTTSTVNDNRLTPIWQHFVSFDFQEPTRQKNGLVQMTLVPLVELPHIQKHEAIAGIELTLNFLNRYFADLLLRLLENLFKVAHCYP